MKMCCLIEILSNKHHSNFLFSLIDSFNLTNLVKEENCVKSQKGFLINIFDL